MFSVNGKKLNPLSALILSIGVGIFIGGLLTAVLPGDISEAVAIRAIARMFGGVFMVRAALPSVVR